MIIGILIGFMTAFFLCLSFYLGYRLGTGSKTKAVKKKTTAEEEEKLKKLNKGLNAIMNYDINTAYGRKD